MVIVAAFWDVAFTVGKPAFGAACVPLASAFASTDAAFTTSTTHTRPSVALMPDCGLRPAPISAWAVPSTSTRLPVFCPMTASRTLAGIRWLLCWIPSSFSCATSWGRGPFVWACACADQLPPRLWPSFIVWPSKSRRTKLSFVTFAPLPSMTVVAISLSEGLASFGVVILGWAPNAPSTLTTGFDPPSLSPPPLLLSSEPHATADSSRAGTASATARRRLFFVWFMSPTGLGG